MYGAGAGAAWSRLFLPGAGADPSRSEPESAPGPWPPGAGAAQKSGGSATLFITSLLYSFEEPGHFEEKNTLSWSKTDRS